MNLHPPGLSRFNTCDRRDHVEDTGKTRWPVRIFYGQFRVFAILSLPLVTFSVYVVRRTLPPSDPTRRRVLRLNFYSIVAFTAEWVGRLSIVLAGLPLWDKAMNDSDLDHPTHISSLRVLSFCFACLEGGRGIFDGMVWFATSGLTAKEIKWNGRRLWAKWTDSEWPPKSQDMFTPLLPKSVSSVLRHDMVRCTSWGIIDSAPVGSRPERNAEAGEGTGAIQLSTMPRNTMGLAGREKLTFSGMFTTANKTHRWFLRQRKDEKRRRIHCPTALHCKHFDFKDYSPEVFASLRELQGISPMTYCNSFGVRDTEASELVEKFTEGRSGSFFYFTLDNRYIVKTVSSSEAVFLRSLIGDYYAHLHKNPDSLLTRFVGLHATRLSPEQNFITLAVMENIFPSDLRVDLSEKYDLKGSWINRKTLTGKDRNKPRSAVTLKDSDLNRKFYIGREKKEKLMQQLRRDVQFLARFGVMDYR